MKFNHYEKHSEIKFSFKERLRILFKGNIKFDHFNTYLFYTHFAHLISEALLKYGDASKHGQQKIDKEISALKNNE